jgi:fumarate hydratase, class I
MKSDLTQDICELIRFTSTDLPSAVESRLREAANREAPGSAARNAMDTILGNVQMTRRNSTPICQDTGTPIFFVQYPFGMDPTEIKRQICQAVELATKKSFLRPNAVHSLTGKNTGTNIGDGYFPSIHFTTVSGDSLTNDLMVKGGGCENVGA